MLSWPGIHWSKWKKEEWNKALFLHFFDSGEGNSSPVRTLSITPETLALVTRDPNASPDAAKSSFLESIGNDPYVIRSVLSPENYYSRTWLKQEPPSFFIFLVFTCFVASASDDSIRGEGNFRTRIRLLLDLDETCSFQLNGLNDVWSLFKEWLAHYRQLGFAYRDIILPDRGNMVLIGYSINISFPKRKDMNQLIAMLKDSKFADEPMQFEIIRMIDDKRNSFSDSFRKEYDTFRRDFFSRALNTVSSFFWSAVKDAWVSNFQKETKERSKFGLILVSCEFDEEDLYLLSETEFQSESTGNLLKFQKTRDNTSSFGYVALPFGDDEREGRHELLLGKNLLHSFQSLNKSSLGVSLQQEFLLFVKNDVGYYEWSNTYEPDDVVRIFIKKYMVDEFLSLFDDNDRPEMKQSPIDRRWCETIPFDSDRLSRIKIPPGSRFWGIRCLQPQFFGSMLVLSGGVRCGKAYLGIPPCLPLVRAADADSIDVYAYNTQVPLKILKNTGEDGEYRFDVPLSDFLEGKYSIKAWVKGEAVGSRTIEFVSSAIPADFKYPKTSNGYFVEGPGPDICDYDHGEKGWVSASPKPLKIEGKCTHPKKKLFRGVSNDIESDYGHLSPSVYSFMEICSAKAVRKQGIPESEFMDLAFRVFPEMDKRRIWDLCRSWVENCYFDKVSDRKWRSNSYYPIPPHFVLNQVEGRYHVALVGLTTRDFRECVDEHMLLGGAFNHHRDSLSPFIVPPPVWVCENKDPLDGLCRELDIPVLGHDVISPSLWSMSEINIGDSDAPSGYVLQDSLDWGKGMFLPPKEVHDSGQLVRIDRMVRNRRDAPDYFLVSYRDEAVWWTYSRNWALLMAHSLAGEIPFVCSGDDGLISSGVQRVYLPVAYARRLAVMSDIIPSPFIGSDGSPGYSYRFPSSAERQRFIDSLWGKSSDSLSDFASELIRFLEISRRMEWRHDGASFPLPKSIRDYLVTLGKSRCSDELVNLRLSAKNLYALRGLQKKYRQVEVTNG